MLSLDCVSVEKAIVFLSSRRVGTYYAGLERSGLLFDLRSRSRNPNNSCYISVEGEENTLEPPKMLYLYSIKSEKQINAFDLI